MIAFAPAVMLAEGLLDAKLYRTTVNVMALCPIRHDMSLLLVFSLTAFYTLDKAATAIS